MRVSESRGGGDLDVIDTGPGIPPELRTADFRPLHGPRPPARSAAPDSGCRSRKWAVEANGGQLTLEPAAAIGSTFRITLPRATAATLHEPRQVSVA